MTCQSSHCFSTVWGQGNTSLRTADAFPVVASLFRGEATTGNASAVRRLGKHTMTSIPSSYYIRFDSFFSRPRSSGWFCRLDLSNTTFTRTRRIKWKSGEAILTRPRYLCSVSFAMPFSTRRPIIIIWKILEAAQATFQLIIIYTVLNELL